MSDLEQALIRAHEANIQRYTRLLHTRLTLLERNFVQRRLAEERTALKRLRMKAKGVDGSPIGCRPPDGGLAAVSAGM